MPLPGSLQASLVDDQLHVDSFLNIIRARGIVLHDVEWTLIVAELRSRRGLPLPAEPEPQLQLAAIVPVQPAPAEPELPAGRYRMRIAKLGTAAVINLWSVFVFV